MEDFQSRFIDFVIANEILKFGRFTLKSGRVSPYFFNAGLFNSGKKLALLGRSYAAAIVHHELQFDTLFGPAYKGIPLASITALTLATDEGIDINYCFNRKEAKDHGEGGMIVGAPLAKRVLVIDDVITAGTAMREAVEIIQQNEAQLSGILVSLDRQEKGRGELSAIQELEQKYQIPVVSIINLQNIIDYMQQNNDPELNAHLAGVIAYREEYGVS